MTGRVNAAICRHASVHVSVSKLKEAASNSPVIADIHPHGLEAA